MAYNLTGLSTNITGLHTLATGINDVLLFGYLGVLFLFIIFGISIVTFLLSTDDAAKAVLASSFVTMLSAMLLLAMGLVSAKTLMITIFVFAASGAMNIKR